MKKILCACGNGMGSSIIIKIKVEKVLENLGINGKVETASVGEAKGIADNFDVILCSNYLASDLKDSKAAIIGLANLLDESQIEMALKNVFNE